MMKRTITKKTHKTKKINIKIEEKTSIILLYDIYINRTKSYGPIALLNINNKIKIIDYHISFIYANFKNPEIIVCVGSEADKIIKYINTKYKNINIRIVENQIHKETNACESLRLCFNNTNNNNILIINGLTLPKKIDYPKQDGVMLYVSENNKKIDIGININENNKVEYMSFNNKNIWLDVMWVTQRRAINIIKNILSQETYKRKMWFELINEVISEKIDVNYTMIKNQMLKIDMIKNLKNVSGDKK